MAGFLAQMFGLHRCLLCSGIDSAKPSSASTQQAFSFGFDAANTSAALEEPIAEEPLPNPPEAPFEAEHGSGHQAPPLPTQQVSANTVFLCKQHEKLQARAPA